MSGRARVSGRAAVSAAIALCVATFASASSGQSRAMTESEMRAAFEGRTVSIKSAGSGTWIMLSMARDGKCALTWSARPYRTRCHIRGGEFCYVSGRKKGMVCGTMTRLSGDDYQFQPK